MYQFEEKFEKAILAGQKQDATKRQLADARKGMDRCFYSTPGLDYPLEWYWMTSSTNTHRVKPLHNGQHHVTAVTFILIKKIWLSEVE